jgi:hypothetical protein
LIELGEMAAESLFTLIEGGEVAEQDRTIPVSLVVRESCGANERPYLSAPSPARNGGAVSSTIDLEGLHA